MISSTRAAILFALWYIVIWLGVRVFTHNLGVSAIHVTIVAFVVLIASVVLGYVMIASIRD